MTCPNCGADLILNGKIKVCNYCGYQERDTSEENDYNVLISCPAGTDMPLKVEIADAAVSIDVVPGGSSRLKLVPGPHNVTFSVAGVKSGRLIYVSDADEVVRISGSYDPSSDNLIKLMIEQPDTKADFSGENNGQLPASNSVLAILSFICTGTCIGAPAGIILGLIDLLLAKKAGRQPNQFALTGLILGCTIVVIWLVIYIGRAL